jgi:hypothetical protein
MQTEINDQYDLLAAAPPLPPPPHFDSASIEEAKPVQLLRKRRVSQPPRGVVRFGTAVFAGLMVMLLGIATMARLNNQINAAATATPEASETADAADGASADVETASDPAAWPNSPSLVVPERRRHRARHYIRLPRETFDFDQLPASGRPKPRLVTVIQ